MSSHAGLHFALSPATVLERRDLVDSLKAETNSIGNQVDHLVSGFIQEAANPTTLAALTAGGLAYRWGKIGVMGLRVGAYCNTPLRAASITFGLGSEVTAFEFTHRFLHTIRATGQSPLQNHSPHLWSFSGPGGWKQSLIADIITFGALKGAGHFSRESNIILRHAFASSAMVTGHQAAGLLNVIPRPEGSLAEQFFHAEATNLQLGAGMALVHAIAPRFTAFERSLDLISRTTVGAGVLPPLQNNFQSLLSSLRPALAGNSGDRGMEAGAFRGRAPLPDSEKKPTLLLMSQKGEGGRKELSPNIQHLLEAARKNQFAVFILRDLARGGSEEAYEALLEVSQNNLEARDVLFDMVLTGAPAALKAYAELAQTKYRALGDLYHLAQKGNESAQKALKELDVSHYAKEPGYDSDIVLALQYAAEWGNERAFETLSQMGEHYRPPLIALYNLAHKGFDRAVELLSRLVPQNFQALLLLNELAVSGNEIALHAAVRFLTRSSQFSFLLTERFLESIKQKALEEQLWAFDLLVELYPLQPKRVVEILVNLARQDKIGFKACAIESLKLASREHNGHHAVYEGLRKLYQIQDAVLYEFSLDAIRTLVQEGNYPAISVLAEIDSGKLKDAFTVERESRAPHEFQVLRAALQFLILKRRSDHDAFKKLAAQVPTEKQLSTFSLTHNALVFLRVLEGLNREELKTFRQSIDLGEINDLRSLDFYQKIERLFTYQGVILYLEGIPIGKAKVKLDPRQFRVNDDDFIPFFENDQEAKMEISRMMDEVRAVIDLSLSELNPYELQEFHQAIQKRPQSLRKTLENRPWFEKVEDFFLTEDEENIPPFTLLTIEDVIQRKLYMN